jgi:hypothetical protein
MLNNRPNMLNTLTTLVLAALIFSSPFVGAESSRPDKQSNARVTISLSILPSISIETASDLNFDIDRRDIDASYEEFFCVKGNISTRYSITAQGNSGSNDDFFLRNQTNDILRYSVGYRGKQDVSQYDRLSPGEPSPVYSVPKGKEPCDGQPNFNIQFKAEDLESAESGLYSGALTLVVEPL